MKYDCIIVGAGPAGVFCAYEFMEKKKDAKILLIEKGKNIYNRKCPVNLHIIDKCPINKEGISGCHPACSITNGLAVQEHSLMGNLTSQLNLVGG